MLTAINLVKLTTILGSGFFYFLGLGWIVMDLLLKSMPTHSWYWRKPPINLLPLLLTSGLIVNYGISLLVQQLSYGLLIGILLSLIGLWNFGHRYLNKQLLTSIKESLDQWIGMCLIFVLYLVPILFEPLNIWDARSVWFFHAKMIYAAGTMGLQAGWQDPSVAFSHVDYPNFVPGIAAQIVHILGFWNEYAPKVSLTFLIAPALMWLFSFYKRRSFSFLILISLPLSLSTWLWNGLMDGYLALYFSISLLLFSRYIQQADFMDLASSVICITLLLYLKNEGQLAFIAGAISITTTLFWERNKQTVFMQGIPLWRQITTTIIILLPFAIWSLYKHLWGLSNDLIVGIAKPFSQFIERLNNGSYILIVQKTIGEMEGVLLLLGLSFFSAATQKIKLPKSILPVLASSAIYYCGLFSVYMLTPFELEWHLNSSINRTTLSIQGPIMIACYYILDLLEHHINHRESIFNSTS